VKTVLGAPEGTNRAYAKAMRAQFLILLMGSAMLSACSEKSPSAPEPAAATVSGTWVGAIDVQGVAGRMTWTLTQTNSSVTGPVLVGLSNGTVLLNGFLTGTLSGSALAYTISVGAGGIPTQPSCAGQMTGTMTVSIAATSTLAGPMTVASSNCAPPFASGTVTLTKQ
jgi:hypothetical protein